MKQSMYVVMVLMIVLWSAVGSAQGLGQYKSQKHGKRKKVTAKSCQREYIARCVKQAACQAKGAVDCQSQCKQQAPTFCKKRSRRRTIKQVEVAAKGASVVAGAVLVLAAKQAEKHLPTKVGRATPYTIFWRDLSVVADMGGGYLFGGVYQGSASLRLRKNWYGLGAQVSYLNDLKTDLYEAEVGPGFYMIAPLLGLAFGIHPSLLISGATDVETQYGFGARSYTTWYLKRLQFSFEPMLGYMNQQWVYHVRVGGLFRFSPRWFGKLSYDYRDVLDLNDLDISQSSLQGATFTLGFRWN